MRFIRFATFVVASIASLASYADASNLLIAFSTKAPNGDYKGDVYADGSRVVDGEWYALCWSKNATFGGVTSECEPVAEGDRILLLAPLASGGHCPTAVFQLEPNEVPEGGNYFVYLFDTRGTTGLPSPKNAATGKPVVLNGSVATNAKSVGGGSVGSGAKTVTDSELVNNASGVAWVESDVDAAKVGQPVITSFQVAGDRVSIKVSNMHPSVRYNIFTGEKPDAISTTVLEVPMSGADNNVTFDLPKSQGKFFKVARQPIK